MAEVIYKYIEKEFHVTQTANHWADENTSIYMLKKILIPKRKSGRSWVLVINLGFLSAMFLRVNGRMQ